MLYRLVTMAHDFLSILDNLGQIDVLFLDMAKAFDKVPHSKLIYKLQLIGLPMYLVE